MCVWVGLRGVEDGPSSFTSDHVAPSERFKYVVVPLKDYSG